MCCPWISKNTNGKMIMKLRPGDGDRVILARSRNEFSLISEQTEDRDYE